MNKLSASLKSINMKNTNLLEHKEDLECPPFVANRIMSCFQDTVGIAEIISMSNIDEDKDCYTIYYGLVSKRSRFKKASFKKKFNLTEDELTFCRNNKISEEKYLDMKDTLNL